MLEQLRAAPEMSVAWDMAALWTNFCNCLRGWAYSAKSITFASLSQNSINMYKMYDGSQLLFLWIPVKEARCRWSNVTPPGNDHAGCLSIIAVCITCAPRGCAVIEQEFQNPRHQSRQIHSRLSHEQILEPLHLGLLEQDDGKRSQNGSTWNNKALQNLSAMLFSWGHRLWHWSKWQRCENCELAANSPQVRSPWNF